MSRMQKYQILMFAMLLCHRIYQLRFIPFGSPDDTFMASQAYSGKSLLSSALDQGTSQGRFYQPIFMLLTMIPYTLVRLEFLWLLIAFQVIFFSLSLIYFTWELWKDLRLSLVIVTTFLLFYDFRGGYNSLTSFPFWFSASFSLYLISLGLLIRSYLVSEEKKRIYRIASWTICFFASLAYESYLIFPFLSLILDLQLNSKVTLSSNSSRRIAFNDLLKRKISSILAVGIFYVAYVSSYATFRFQFPTDYSGTQVTFNEPAKVLETALRLSAAGYGAFARTFSNFDLHEFFSILYMPAASTILFFILNLTNVFFALTCRTKVDRIGVWCIAIFLPNLLYSLTERYQDISQVAPLYLGALLSTVAISILFVKVLQSFVRVKKSGYLAYLLVISLVLTVVSVRNDTEIIDYVDNRRAQNVAWKFVDAYLSDNSVKNEKLIWLSPDLDDLIQTHESYLFWKNYLSMRSNSRVDFFSSDENLKFQGYLRIEIFKEEKGVAFIGREVGVDGSERVKFVYVYRGENLGVEPIKLIDGFSISNSSSEEFVVFSPKRGVDQGVLNDALLQSLNQS